MTASIIVLYSYLIAPAQRRRTNLTNLYTGWNAQDSQKLRLSQDALLFLDVVHGLAVVLSTRFFP